jgi:hypothetical protein
MEHTREHLTIGVDGGMIVVADAKLLARAVQAAPSPDALGRVFARPFVDALMTRAQLRQGARRKERSARIPAPTSSNVAVIPRGVVVLPGFGDGAYEAIVMRDDEGMAVAVECKFVAAEQAQPCATGEVSSIPH